jgi:hypothetical protein
VSHIISYVEDVHLGSSNLVKGRLFNILTALRKEGLLLGEIMHFKSYVALIHKITSAYLSNSGSGSFKIRTVQKDLTIK